MFLKLQAEQQTKIVLYIDGSRPDWCISSMMNNGDTPFWLETLDIVIGAAWLNSMSVHFTTEKKGRGGGGNQNQPNEQQ